MRIVIKGVDRILKHLHKYDNLQQKLFEVAKKLCEVGEPIIRETHGSTSSIQVIQTQHGYAISAEGPDILFIEFGTGDMAGVMDVLYDQVPSEVGMGKWSATHAQMWTRYGFWVFAGQIYHYTEPHPAFYYAYEAMVQALPQVVREVFK